MADRRIITWEFWKDAIRSKSGEHGVKLKEKPEFTNPDEFYFKMINSRTVGGIHRPKPEDNKYTEEELLLLKNKDMGYILQSIQCEKRWLFYFREEAKEIQSRIGQSNKMRDLDNIPSRTKKKIASSYRELEEMKQRLQKLEKLYATATSSATQPRWAGLALSPASGCSASAYS
ncbi:putative U3 small nucleolar RNA-associated protein 11 [Zea mays]|uniref:Putative U3 small nucleolar RNA-associated protein 11 n=1 Tax=Zea mays TaxID=4577 RepID=K7UF59_MAIZE|nr:putative U3 small nucleolar RNA-associated protein 11 [Zea mays]